MISPAIDVGFDVLAECRLENINAENATQDDVFWKDIALTVKALPYRLDEN